LQIETADVSLIGHREENQDRVAVAAADQAVLLVVIDGMGGHAEGARAAETALASLLEAFWQTPRRSAPARDLRIVPGPGLRGLLGACGR